MLQSCSLKRCVLRVRVCVFRIESCVFACVMTHLALKYGYTDVAELLVEKVCAVRVCARVSNRARSGDALLKMSRNLGLKYSNNNVAELLVEKVCVACACVRI